MSYTDLPPASVVVMTAPPWEDNAVVDATWLAVGCAAPGGGGGWAGTSLPDEVVMGLELATGGRTVGMQWP